MKEVMMYCVSCCRMLPITQSHNLYKTGFYKHNVPAGVCKECQSALLVHHR
jgi:hypothetical protein